MLRVATPGRHNEATRYNFKYSCNNIGQHTNDKSAKFEGVVCRADGPASHGFGCKSMMRRRDAR
jgi:hypothetical protein